jgi:hypothetical protein
MLIVKLFDLKSVKIYFRLEQKRMDDEYEKKINEIVKKAQEKKLQVQKNEEVTNEFLLKQKILIN